MTDSTPRRSGTTDDDVDVSTGIHKFYDGRAKRQTVRVGPGAYYVTSEKNVVLTAVLGSCISACARDPITGCGGMNHFMLPTQSTHNLQPDQFDLRCGAHALEVLINDILTLGCPRNRMEVKIFGGSNLFGTEKPIGTINIDFTLDYFKREGMSVIAKDVGGTKPRRLEYFPETGRARVKMIEEDPQHQIRTAEERLQRILRKQSKDDDVELF